MMQIAPHHGNKTKGVTEDGSEGHGNDGEDKDSTGNYGKGFILDMIEGLFSVMDATSMEISLYFFEKIQ